MVTAFIHIFIFYQYLTYLTSHFHKNVQNLHDFYDFYETQQKLSTSISKSQILVDNSISFV